MEHHLGTGYNLNGDRERAGTASETGEWHLERQIWGCFGLDLGLFGDRVGAALGQSLKRNATLCDIVKNIDAANLDSLHMDETLSMALENIENQGYPNAKDSNVFQPEPKAIYKSGNKESQNPDSPKNRVLNNHEEVKFQRKIDGQIDALQSRHESFENACTHGIQDVDKLLNQCYEMLRGQIVEVAERMEMHLLTLKGDVQRLTSDMQARLSCLERQALHLEQILPVKNQKGQQTGQSYGRIRPSQKPNDSSVHALCRVKENDDIQQKLIGELSNHPDQVNTQKLIATVKARCNKTKELLMGNQKSEMLT
ncbi:hypothetical protein L7F22_059731 [Adiantum nelumboides]|nr:hypothetical protein [Adiantum nelumboides]